MIGEMNNFKVKVKNLKGMCVDMNSIKSIALDVGGVLAEPATGYWYITPNFWSILDKSKIKPGYNRHGKIIYIA